MQTNILGARQHVSLSLGSHKKFQELVALSCPCTSDDTACSKEVIYLIYAPKDKLGSDKSMSTSQAEGMLLDEEE